MKVFALCIGLFLLSSPLPGQGSGPIIDLEDRVEVKKYQHNFISFQKSAGTLTFTQGETEASMKLGALKIKEEFKKPILSGAFGPGDQHEGKEWHWESRSKDQEMLFGIRLIDEGSTFLLDAIVDGKPGPGRLTFWFDAGEEESFFGFGEQFSAVDMKGKKFDLIVEEQGIGRGDKGATGLTALAGASGNEFTTYCPVPFFMTSALRAFWIMTDQRLSIDLSQKGKVGLSLLGTGMRLRIYKGDSPLELLEQYSENSGRPRLLPDWAYGSWYGIQGGTQKAERIVDEAIEAGNPLTAVWIQDWVGKRKTKYGSRLFWNWELDRKAYPDFEGMRDRLAAKGVKLLAYINPFLAEESSLAEEAKEKGILVKDSSGVDYLIPAGGFEAYLLDFTHPDTREWIGGIIQKNMIDLGFSGWMADFGEWLPPDAKLHRSGFWEEQHNRYPVEWQRANQFAAINSGKSRELLWFHRSGWHGSQEAAPLLWAGDQLTGWGEHDGIHSALKGILSSGLSGFCFNHSDIGGYTNIKFPFVNYHRKQELMFRWAEMGAFMPVFRSHEGLQPERNYQPWSDSVSVAFFARMGKLHQALKPLFKRAAHEANQRGWPVIRHPWLQFYQDFQCRALDTQFMVGDELMVCPVLAPGAEELQAYLPSGQWQRLQFDGNTLTKGEAFTSAGEWLEVKAPIGEPVAFWRVP